MTLQYSLRAEQISCRRNDRLLFQNLDLQTDAGDMLEICGRNGSGKTTLLRMLCGLRRPDEGDIFWRDKSIYREAEEYRSDLCYVGHQSGLKEDLSPYDNLCAEAQLYGADISNVEGSLERLGLKREIDVPCRRLSAGQRQRTALARLLVRKARLWILDEPYASLDRQAQADIQTLLEAHALQGGTVIFTTHQPIEFNRVQVKQLWLDKGQVDA